MLKRSTSNRSKRQRRNLSGRLITTPVINCEWIITIAWTFITCAFSFERNDVFNTTHDDNYFKREKDSERILRIQIEDSILDSHTTLEDLARIYRSMQNDAEHMIVDYDGIHPFEMKDRRLGEKVKKAEQISFRANDKAKTSNPSSSSSAEIENIYVGRYGKKDEKKTSSTNPSPSSTPTLTPPETENYPIRIKFDTSAIQLRNDESTLHKVRVDTIVNKILPRMVDVWSSLLSVVPVTGNITLSSDSCFGFFPHILSNVIKDADLVVLVSGYNTFNGKKLCGQNTLASASFCSMDQFDRPVIGFINFCLDNIESALNNEINEIDTYEVLSSTQGYITKETEDRILGVAVHELAHILGLSDDLFKYFRDSKTGDPLTPRPFDTREVSCVDGSKRQLQMASTKTIEQRIGTNNNGEFVYFDLVTPSVTAMARNQFGCQELKGARLENQPTNRKSCTGAHWDERLFYTELLSPVISAVESSLLSPLTIALMEDTGWYQVNYTSIFLQNSPYGFGAGCPFVYDDCIDKESDRVPENFKPYFCDSVNHIIAGRIDTFADTFCDPSHSHIAYCDLFDINSDLPEDFPAPKANRTHHFSNPNIVSLFSQGDFCPLPTVYSIACTDDSIKSYQLSGIEEYGTHSKCFNSHVFRSNYGIVKHATCLRAKCNNEKKSIDVYVGDEKLTCSYDGQIHYFRKSSRSYFTCPPLASMCPNLVCPTLCSGKGICNFQTSKCDCFDKEDTSPGCYGKNYVNRPITSNFVDIRDYETIRTHSTNGQASFKPYSLLYSLLLHYFIYLK